MKKLCFFVFIGIILAAGHPSAAQTAASWIERGESLDRQGVYAEAVKAYSKAIELDPDRADAYLKRGVARFAGQKTNCVEALADLTESVRRAPTHAEAYYQRGTVNYFLINNEQGRRDMETAVALGHPRAGAWLERTAGDGGDEGGSARPPTIYFHHDRADIEPSYFPLLETIGAAVRAKSPSVVIEGHADSTGTDEYNQSLSWRRATAVKTFLMEQAGIVPRRIIVRAFGEEVPVASNDTEEGRAANRRVEIIGISP